MEETPAPGTATGVGSLPHTDPVAAAELVLALEPELPAIPSLPRRSPAEGMLAQAVCGVAGIDLDGDGALLVDAGGLDPARPVRLDLDHDSFGGLRAFLAVAAGRQAPVKWQVTGPLTLGLGLVRRGAAPEVAFPVAAAAVAAHLEAIGDAVAAALPRCQQVVVLDEPALTGVLTSGLPLLPTRAIDVLSAALAVVEPGALAGVHHCGSGDLVALLAAGPGLLSVPLRVDLVDVAGYLEAFLERGGRIAWGVVPTDRPVAGNADRYTRELEELWAALVAAGCDGERLRRQSLVTPACGLAFHDPPQAERVLGLVAEVGAWVAASTADDGLHPSPVAPPD